MNIQQKAIKFYKMFETIKRGEETIITFGENASQELKDSVYQAHGDRLPNDWYFDKYESILGTIIDYDCKTLEELDEQRLEIVDSLVDIYTSSLTSWLNDNNYNVYYLTEALEETDTKDGFQLLSMAQYKAIDEIFSEVYSLLEK